MAKPGRRGLGDGHWPGRQRSDGPTRHQRPRVGRGYRFFLCQLRTEARHSIVEPVIPPHFPKVVVYERQR